MTGSITKHKQKNGRISWGYYFRPCKDADGKWIQVKKQGFASKGGADDALRDAINAYKEKPPAIAEPKVEPKTFGDYFNEWIEQHCRRDCEATTVEGYEKKGAYVKRYFWNAPITDITPLQIQTTLNELRDRGGKKTSEHPQGRPLSTKTVREIAAVVHMTYAAMVRWGVMDLNPMARVTLPRMEKPEPKVLERSDLEWLIGAVESHEWLSVLFLLDAATGCRRGEMLALAWPDIDFEMRTLSVTKSLAQTRAGIFLKAPKGRKARRFSLPISTIEALREHRAKQVHNRQMFGGDYRTDLDLVFATPEGNYLKPDSVTAKVSALARRLGFPKGVSLHTLRHTHGSHLLSSGVPLPTVSKRLGHANTHITASVYSHALEKDDHLSAEAWEKSMGDLGKSNQASARKAN